MKNQQTKATKFFNKVTSHYKVILALSIIVMIGVALFIPKMTKDTSYDAFLPKDDPILVFRNQTKETFGLKDPMVIAVVNEQGVFNKKTLELVHELTERLKTIPGIDPDEITSLATENNIVGTDDGLEVDPFFEISELTEDKAKEVANAIDDFELYQGSLVSNDHTTTLVVGEMLDSYDKKQHEVYKSLMAMLDEYKIRNEQFYLAGEGAVSGYLIRYIDEDAMKTNPFAAVVISIILIFAYRRARGVILPNIMVLASVGIALGAMAAFGVDFFVITNGLPVVLIAIAVADGIHILGEYYETAAKHPEYSQKELVVQTMIHMWRPVTITSVTTIAGFLAIAASSYMPPMTYFGLFGALGVFVALVYAVFMIPSAMMFLKPQLSRAYKRDQKIDRFGKIMEYIGTLVIKRPKTIVVIAVVIVGLGINGASKLVINEDRIKNFQSDEPIVQADALINSKTDGTSYLDILIETPEAEDIFEPENLRKMETLQEYVETLPHVKGSISIVDFLKKMNQSLNENDSAFYTIPDNRELIAQYFLLYSASGDPTDFDNYVDYDYRLANIRLRMDTSEYLFEKPVVDQTKAYITEHFNSDTIKATTTGKVTVDAYWINRLGFNHFLGAGLALLVVLIFAALSFRSFWAGVLTIIPVSISVLFIYTVMGVLNIWLAIGTSMFAAIAIGIGVDFAVHTVDRLKYLFNEKGLSIQQAYKEFYKSAGRALLFNFLALALGFSVLMTSSVPPLSQFGFLVAVAVSVSFIGSLTLLPAIILLMKPKFLNIKPSKTNNNNINKLKTIKVKTYVIIGLLATVLLFPANSTAQSLPSGKSIADKTYARNEGVSMSRKLTMELKDKRGKVRVRETTSLRKYFGDEKRLAIFYLTPKSVMGTAFLTYDYPDASIDDDQWLYMPALRKTRRISAANRGDYFLGTDLTYEDIKLETRISREDYDYKTIGKETIDGQECYVLEGTPKDAKIAKELGYSKVKLWVDASIWMLRRADSWDIAGNHLKTTVISDIKKVQDIWTYHQIEVKNHKTNHETIFRISDIDYRTELNDDVFTKEALVNGL